MDRTDWHLLECFRVAGRLQHVTRAAEQLGTSQPALSRSLARLQSDLGVQLFRRAGRSIRLTEPGELFLSRVERALGEIDNGRRELADFKAADQGLCRSDSCERSARDTFRNWSAASAWSTRRCVLPSSRTTALRSKRSSNAAQLDLIFVAVPPGHADFGWTHVGDQQLVLIVPRSHRLARRRQVRLHDVAGERFVSFKLGHAIRRMTDDLCKAAGFLPDISFEADDSSSVPGFVAAGFGVGIVPPEACGYADVASLKIIEPIARRPIGLAWMEGRYLSASARLFRDFVTTAKSPSRRLLQQR